MLQPHNPVSFLFLRVPARGLQARVVWCLGMRRSIGQVHPNVTTLGMAIQELLPGDRG